MTNMTGMSLASSGGAGKPKSVERGQGHHTHTGQKSVTNKYTKVLSGIGEDLEGHPAA